MQINETTKTVTIEGCPDCPLCHTYKAQGGDDVMCEYLKMYTMKNHNEDYILDDCPLAQRQSITIVRSH